MRFKGSQIGRQFSYAKLNERLADDGHQQESHPRPDNLNVVVSEYWHRPFLLYVPADNKDLRPVKRDRRTAISGLEVQGSKGYAAREQC